MGGEVVEGTYVICEWRLYVGIQLRSIVLTDAPAGVFQRLHRHAETLVTLFLRHTFTTLKNYRVVCEALSGEFPQLAALTHATLHFGLELTIERARLNSYDREGSFGQKLKLDAILPEAECRQLLNVEWRMPTVSWLSLISDERLRFPRVVAPRLRSFVGEGVTVHEITSILKEAPLLQKLKGQVLVLDELENARDAPSQDDLDRQNADANVLLRTAIVAGGGRNLDTLTLGHAGDGVHKKYSYLRLNGETLLALALRCPRLATLKCEPWRVNEQQLIEFLHMTAAHLQELSLQYGHIWPIDIDSDSQPPSMSSIPMSSTLMSSTPVSSTPVSSKLVSSTPVSSRLVSSTSVSSTSVSSTSVSSTSVRAVAIKLERLTALSVSVPHDILTRVFVFGKLECLSCETSTRNPLAAVMAACPQLRVLRLVDSRYDQVQQQLVAPRQTNVLRSHVHSLHVDNPGRRVSALLSWCAATLHKLTIDSGTPSTLVTLAACGHIAPRLEQLCYNGSWRTARSHELFAPLLLAFRFLHTLSVSATDAQLRAADEDYDTENCESHRKKWHTRLQDLYKSLPAPTADPKTPLVLKWNIGEE